MAATASNSPSSPSPSPSPSAGAFEPAIIVHGGAWQIPDSLKPANLAGVERAVRAAWAILTRTSATSPSGSASSSPLSSTSSDALDAVEAAVRVLEDDPSFDAGHGSVLNAGGFVEMDSIIMDGRSLKSGAVAAVRSVANPVTLARAVMERTPHALLVGEGADRFAREICVPSVDAKELVTREAQAEFEQFRAKAFNTVRVQHSTQRHSTAERSGAPALHCNCH
jgi:L-asparaginase / beta-aspartyl-peptidase